MASASDSQRVRIAGRELTVTHLTKVLYPASGFTKADVLAYYARVAPALIPLLAQRPATRKRWVEGTAHPPFFAREMEDGAPAWVPRAAIDHHERRIDYPLINDLATLTYLAQLASLEMHVPQWRFADDGTRLGPDRLVIDLDPGEGVGLRECADVARWLRAVLDGMSLECFAVTSGSKGLHLYARLDGQASSDQVTAMARELARAMEADHPGEVVATMRKAVRRGKVFLDWSQNRASKTTIAPYSLRGLDQPWAAAPRTWQELEDPGLRQLTGVEVAGRLERDGDLLAGLRPGIGQRLGAYSAKRHAGRTPEPPARGTAATVARHAEREPVAPRYVLHHHLARREHWDLRLEHDGTLTCWALPKGLPGLGEPNRLAIHTEDHPVGYADFEGSIPPGNYGAGHLAIAEAGTYQAHKWRDGEVIVTLRPREVAPAESAGSGGEEWRAAAGGAVGGERDDGTPAGAERHVALVRMGAAGGADADSWLIHRMSAPPSAGGHRHRARVAARSERPRGPGRDAGREAPPDDGPAAPAPMLAEVAPPAVRLASGWSFEMKWDGIRCLARAGHGRVRLYSRSGRELTGEYPDLASAALQGRLADGDMVDGEIVAFGAGGRPDFACLQRRFGASGSRALELARAQPVDFIAFDLLAEAGQSLVTQPYRERRTALARRLPEGGRVHVPPAFDGDLAAAWSASRELGLEGVMAKRLTSPYLPGTRSPDWLKLKHRASIDVLVVGWRPSQAEPGAAASLLLAEPQGATGPPRYAGRVGAGLPEAERVRLPRELGPSIVAEPVCTDVPPEVAREAVWFTPALPAEVLAAGRTGSGRLRQPVWRGWRPDLEPRADSPNR